MKDHILSMVELEKSLIDSLQKMDLNYEEAQIYYNLLKHGKKGTIVRKLREELPFIERTTLYSILKRLIEKKCVKEGPQSGDSKKLKIFTATDPTEYFNRIFMRKKKEFEYLKEIKVKIIENLQNMYISGLNLSYDDLDPFIQPYFESLLKKGWIVKTQRKNQGINIFGGELYYEYHLHHPKLSNKIRMIGFLISIYDSDIEKDNMTIKFLTEQLKKIIKELHKTDFKRIDITDGEIELFGRTYPSIIIKAEEKASKNYVDFGDTAILPIKNKIFFIWEELIHENVEHDKAELHSILIEMVEQIFIVEAV
ncbi:MAG: helix-turn-helix domain-containing protein [Candidatus Thorarchaeota archaeon]